MTKKTLQLFVQRSKSWSHRYAIRAFLICGWALASLGTLHASEYFVSLEGSDQSNGTARDQAFRTIQKGVDALEQGDTLTILPGEYFEAVKRENLGGPDRETVIRAEIPGTVLLRGDVPMPPLKPAEGNPSIFEADFTQPVQAVNERTTLTMLTKAVSKDDLAFLPGGYFHDAENGRLYISASDLQKPDASAYSVSVLGTHGLYLEGPQRVVIDGIAATGFNTAEMIDIYPGFRGAWGIVIGSGKSCVIRHCTAFFNGGGIALNTAGRGKKFQPGSDNVIEHSTAWGNASRYISEGAGIAAFNVNNDIIRFCEAYHSGRGLRVYGAIGPGKIEHSLARDGIIQIKGGILHSVDGPGLVDRSIGLGNVDSFNLSHSIVGIWNTYHRGIETTMDNILLAGEKELNPDAEFADPENYDFRLQATSRFRGTGPDKSDRGPFPYKETIFYLRAEGNDKADGLSLAKAWQTPAAAASRLRAGHTLYLAPGKYAGGMEVKTSKGEPISIRGRGESLTDIDGAVQVSGPGSVTFERIRFSGPVTVTGGHDAVFLNCEFAKTADALKMDGTKGVRIENSRFSQGGANLSNCDGIHLSGNIFDVGKAPAITVNNFSNVRYADYNVYPSAESCWKEGSKEIPTAELRPAFERYSRIGPGIATTLAAPFAREAGPYRPPNQQPLNVTAPLLHSATDTTANFEWRTSNPVDCQLAWRIVGGEKEDWKRERWPLRIMGFTSYSLWGLEPDTEYEFQVTMTDPFLLDGKVVDQDPLLLTFRTDAKPGAPVEWFVATDGSDAADGRSRQKALRTVNAAATRASAGDTVWVAEGTYSEIVYVRSTGDKERPLTFRSLPGEKVVFDGRERALPHAFILTGKADVHIDGFYFTGFGFGGRRARDSYHSNTSGILNLCVTEDVHITRCFADGRGSGYAPPLVGATYSPRLLIQNCVIAAGSGLNLRFCQHARIENNVLFRSLIQQYVVVGWSKQHEFQSARNIIVDNPANKVKSLLLEVPRIEAMKESENCYYLRVPDEERKMFLASGVRMSLADYQKKYGDKGSFVGDPKFAGIAAQEYKDFAGNPVMSSDLLIGKKDLDFPDLFATNPRLVKPGIGLQPEAFKDFHFHNAKELPHK